MATVYSVCKCKACSPSEKEGEEDDFTEWVMKVRKEHILNLMLNISRGLIYAGILSIIVAGVVGVWSSSASLFIKVAASGLIVLVAGGLGEFIIREELRN